MKTKRRSSVAYNLEGQSSPVTAKKSKTNDGDEEMFVKPWKGSDGVLVVEDREIHVHTNILSISSKYFDSMFNGNFKEGTSKRVVLTGKDYELVEHMLRLIYPLEASLTPNSFLVCGSCKDAPPKKRAVASNVEEYKRNPNPSNSEICLKCGDRFMKMDEDRRLILDHIKKLWEVSQEFIIDILSKKIKSEIGQQSQTIQTSAHAFDLLEIADVISSKSVKNACFNYLPSILTSLSKLRNGLSGRKIGLESRLRLKGILYRNLFKRLKPKDRLDEDVTKDFNNLTDELVVFDLAEEIADPTSDDEYGSSCESESNASSEH